MEVAPPPVGRRIKAAMELAGIGSFAELAERIDQRGLGERTLRKLADDRALDRPAQRRDLNLIAEACGVSLSWFSVPFEWMDEAQVVDVDVPLPDDLEVDGLSVADLGDFAVSRGVRSVQAPPLDFSRSAYAVLERSGRLFWWTRQAESLAFHFARPMPAGFDGSEANVRDQHLVRLRALQDLLDAWLGAVETARRYASNLGNKEMALTMDSMALKVRTAIEHITLFTINDIAAATVEDHQSEELKNALLAIARDLGGGEADQ